MSISIDIDLDELWHQVSDREFRTETARRALGQEKQQQDAAREAITTAIDQIRRGDTLDAITTLEREFWPKWPSVEQSAAAYLKATGDLLAHNDNQEAAGVPAVA